ncbi:MAG TPA: hypothetical protein VFQ76_03150 [Longimicrobiaceae bacterium]|nr:hypothetical protein [Longimicrobiaceae bacterium]
MRRSLIHLRRALLGVSCTAVFGFGATQALGSTDRAPRKFCPTEDPPYPYYSAFCGSGCVDGIGYCGEDGQCHCGDIP